LHYVARNPIEEVLVTRKLMTWIIVTLVALVSLGCVQREVTTTSGKNPTIAAPEPQPEPTGTGEMTQTVDIEDSRSESDGGVLTSPNPPIRSAGVTAKPATGTTATSTVTTTRTTTTP